MLSSIDELSDRQIEIEAARRAAMTEEGRRLEDEKLRKRFAISSTRERIGRFSDRLLLNGEEKSEQELQEIKRRVFELLDTLQ